MKKKSSSLILMFFYTISYCQIGIGTNTPSKSAILDLNSNSKGLLTPRMTTEERNLIVNPAQGLLIYNTISSDFNYYDSGWNDFSKIQKSAFALNLVSTSLPINGVIPGMKVEPEAGTYLVSFNSQYSNKNLITTQVNTEVCNADLINIYTQLINVPITLTTNQIVFGNAVRETLSPGKYKVGSAITVQSNLVLDGGGNQNAVFIFYANGDITFSSLTTILLTNGAKAENVFWLSEGAVNVGAGSTIKGTLFSHNAAVSVGSQSVLEGRMFSTFGAIAFGSGSASLPSDIPHTINLNSLSNFVVYTSAGAINNTGTTTVYNGDLATHAGDTSSLAQTIVNGNIYPTGVSSAAVISGENLKVTYVIFSVFKNGVKVPASSRRVTCDSDLNTILLQALVTVNLGDSIDIRWRTESGFTAIEKRSLILTKV
jgi:hypothetical protein